MDDPRLDDGPFVGAADEEGTAQEPADPELRARTWVATPAPRPGLAVVYGPPEDPVALSRKPPADWQELLWAIGKRGRH